MKFASESDDASRNVKLHAKHVIASSKNVIEHSKLALIEADAILEVEEAAEAAPHAINLHIIPKQP